MDSPQGYPPQHDPYASTYQRPTTDQLIQGSYPRGRSQLDRHFTTDKVIRYIVLGLLLMFIGGVIYTLVNTSGGPNLYDKAYDDDDNGNPDADKWDNYYEDRRAYDTIRDVGTIIGKLILTLGMLMTVVVLFGGGITNREFETHIRIAMIIAAGLIVGWSGFL